LRSCDEEEGSAQRPPRPHAPFRASASTAAARRAAEYSCPSRSRRISSGPIIKPPWPLIFDLIDDPVEEWALVENCLQGAWVVALARSLGIRLVAGELLAGLDVLVAGGALDEGAQSLGEGR